MLGWKRDDKGLYTEVKERHWENIKRLQNDMMDDEELVD